MVPQSFPADIRSAPTTTRNALPDNDNRPRFLTTKEVAELLRVKERKVYDLAAADEIPHRRITGKLLFPTDEIHAWIEGPQAQPRKARPSVLAGSHDPLLDWAIRASGCGLATLCNGSRDGLEKFLSRDAALAGIHLPDETGWNLSAVRDLKLDDSVLIAWAVRKRGLLISKDAVGGIRSIEDLKGKRVALRQPGSGTSVLFSGLLAKTGLSEGDLAPAGDHAHTEHDAAAAVMTGEADAALGLEALAGQFKLAFLPLTEENFDLLIDRTSYFTEPVQRLLNFTRSKDFHDKAAALGGYALNDTGAVRWLSQ
ncbi:helix-turn-helix transcriptional regulator [Labrenzia aggregata]|uniref:Helix-turn-helix transcriptional regulator n=1 Tax=Roseibium aggregatum TaxID=187304 RepID=A0A939EGR4_9HYPH|nr:helix-turn-helix transcriptional regulator [Roseibium aggregatum]